jgi:glycosyltransferase involved in cell wall biosynthesis
MTQPLVSVLMPVYNDKKYVTEAVESILKQTYANIEMIIVDDGSDSETQNVLRNLASLDPRSADYLSLQ